MSATTHDERSRERVTAQISDAIVRLLAAHTGHGATRAWTTFGDDVIVCVLQDVLSKGERSLVEDGRGDVALTARRAYQEMMEGDAVIAVEEISGRSVRAFMSANHLDGDLAAEIFVLEPLADADGDGDGYARA